MNNKTIELIAPKINFKKNKLVIEEYDTGEGIVQAHLFLLDSILCATKETYEANDSTVVIDEITITFKGNNKLLLSYADNSDEADLVFKELINF